MALIVMALYSYLWLWQLCGVLYRAVPGARLDFSAVRIIIAARVRPAEGVLWPPHHQPRLRRVRPA